MMMIVSLHNRANKTSKENKIFCISSTQMVVAKMLQDKILAYVHQKYLQPQPTYEWIKAFLMGLIYKKADWFVNMEGR